MRKIFSNTEVYLLDISPSSVGSSSLPSCLTLRDPGRSLPQSSPHKSYSIIQPISAGLFSILLQATALLNYITGTWTPFLWKGLDRASLLETPCAAVGLHRLDLQSGGVAGAAGSLPRWLHHELAGWGSWPQNSASLQVASPWAECPSDDGHPSERAAPRPRRSCSAFYICLRSQLRQLYPIPWAT